MSKQIKENTIPFVNIHNPEMTIMFHFIKTNLQILTQSRKMKNLVDENHIKSNKCHLKRTLNMSGEQNSHQWIRQDNP